MVWVSPFSGFISFTNFFKIIPTEKLLGKGICPTDLIYMIKKEGTSNTPGMKGTAKKKRLNHKRVKASSLSILFTPPETPPSS